MCNTEKSEDVQRKRRTETENTVSDTLIQDWRKKKLQINHTYCSRSHRAAGQSRRSGQTYTLIIFSTMTNFMVGEVTYLGATNTPANMVYANNSVIRSAL